MDFAPRSEAQKSMDFKNGLSLTHFKVHDGGLRAFVSLGRAFLNTDIERNRRYFRFHSLIIVFSSFVLCYIIVLFFASCAPFFGIFNLLGSKKKKKWNCKGFKFWWLETWMMKFLV